MSRTINKVHDKKIRIPVDPDNDVFDEIRIATNGADCPYDETSDSTDTVKSRIENTNTIIGVLANLTTSVKTSIVNAINQVYNALTTHTGNGTVHITTAERTAWNAKQNANTAITTSNIGQQSVNYATSAGTAAACTGKISNAANADYATSAGSAKTAGSCTGNAATSSSCSGNAATATTAGYADTTNKSNYMRLHNAGEENCYFYYIDGRAKLCADNLETRCDYATNSANASTSDFALNAGKVSSTEDCSANSLTLWNGSINSNTHAYINSKNSDCSVYASGYGFYVTKPGRSENAPAWASVWNVSSSRKVKENIKSMTEEEIRQILNIDPVSFDYKECVGGTKDQRGVIAEEAVKYVPSAVTIPDGYKEENFDESKGIMQKIPGVDYSRFSPYLIGMTKIHEQNIIDLNKKIDEQNTKIEELETKLNQLLEATEAN